MQVTQQRARRRCSRNSRLLCCLGLGVLLLNLCCGYALLSLHGVVHAPPVLLSRLVASGLAAPPKDDAPPKDEAEAEAEAEAEREEASERDEWDVAEDLLAAHEKAVPANPNPDPAPKRNPNRNRDPDPNPNLGPGPSRPP